MKISILTQPLFCNYGGILQNYAFQTVLKRLGHEPLTVNVPARYPEGKGSWKDSLKVIRNIIRRVKGAYQYPFLNPHTFALKEHALSFPQREFVYKYIAKADEEGPFSAEVAKRHPADAWIVGSDQVWRPWCSPHIENSFLDFVDEDTQKIAYAASFGTDEWEITQKMTQRVAELAKRFSAVSVRESSGVELAKEKLGIEAVHVLDPTMLLSAEDYLSLTSRSDYPEGKYLATYVLDITREKTRTIKRIAKANGLRVHKIGQMHRDRFDTVESWIAGIAHADKVVTDSFHGTVFSLIFGRPVKVMANSMRGNARINSLIDMLNPNRDSDGFLRMTQESHSLLEEWRKKSMDFLSIGLNK